MNAPALATSGLAKSFGSLVVASDIEIALPQGVRYALIGPNGAGKTTLINLITGMLRPDAGRILLDDTDITGLAPDQRVRRGLVRTYQINSLFPHLTALESVTLSICERTRAARTWWRQLPGFSHEIDEAFEILTALRLEAVCNRPTRELAYGQQRLLEIALALATRPKVLLLDEPAAGVPREESKELFAASPASRARSPCSLSSTTWSSFFALRRASSSWSAGVSWSKVRRRRSPPIRACARSISASPSTRLRRE